MKKQVELLLKLKQQTMVLVRRNIMEKNLKKKVTCLKCKKKFESEIDFLGIPYYKICPSCKKNTGNYGRGISSYS